MQKKILLDKIKHGVSHIHDDVFQDIHVEEIINEKDPYVNKALDKYVQYFNYCENQDKYNLKYCFKTTINDLNDFYSFQETKLEEIRENEILCDLEHKVNEHIYDEIIICQKKVNRTYLFNMFTSYLLAFILIFGITEITHFVQLNTLIGSTILALIMAFVKIFIDKKYLEVVRNKVGWKSYRFAVKRSLAFYFASVIILNQCEHHRYTSLTDDTHVELKSQVHEAIDILLEEMIFKES